MEKHASGKSVHFILTDDAVMLELPSHVQQMCPLSLTHKSGVCVGLCDTLVAALPLGISVSDFCNLRNEVRAAGHVCAGLSYYITVAGLKKHKPGRQLSLSESLTCKHMAAQVSMSGLGTRVWSWLVRPLRMLLDRCEHHLASGCRAQERQEDPA